MWLRQAVFKKKIFKQFKKYCTFNTLYINNEEAFLDIRKNSVYLIRIHQGIEAWHRCGGKVW